MNTFFLSVGLLISVSACAQDIEERLKNSFTRHVKDSGKVNAGLHPQLVHADKRVIINGIKNGSLGFATELAEGYYVIIPKGPVNSLKNVRVIGQANDQWKLSPSLAQSAVFKEGQYTVTCLDAAEFRFFLSLHSIEPEILREHPASKNLVIKLHRHADLKTILTSVTVVFVDKCKQAYPETTNYFQDISVNKVNAVHHRYPYLNGSGLIFSLKERALDKTDIDLKGRVIPSSLEDTVISIHANQMATIIAGAGNSVPSSRGVAWGSEITSSSFSELLPDNSSLLQRLSVSLQNHSYGVGLENYYGAEARAYDVSMNNDPQMMHVFSSGNLGPETNSEGLYKNVISYANLSGNLKMAKNVLVSGAHFQDGEIDYRNSRGPAYDGRLKPDLVAFGPEGTSGAAALVSGISLLVQQAFRNNNGALPPSALVKGILIATAEDVGAPGIDFMSGYGAVNALKAVELTNDNLFLSDAVAPASQKQFDINIPVGIKSLRVVLTWNDPAANSGSVKALVNDLDLELAHSFSGARWLPWVLSHYPHIDSLSALPERRRDRLNNVELISVDNPAPGTYQCLVTGYELATSTQNFHVTYWLDTANVFDWTFPTSSDPVAGDNEINFRWETSIEGPGLLEVSVNNSPFEEVSESVDLAQGFHQWISTNTTGTAVARMKIGSSYYLSDTFSISPSMEIKVGYNCSNDAMLTWNKVPGAIAYEISSLGDQYMETIVTLSDTVLFISKDVNSSPYAAIAPVLNSGTGVRSATYDYTLQGVHCYYNNFYAILEDHAKVNLFINLSTSYNVGRVVFEKLSDDAFISLYENVVEGALQYEYSDVLLKGGVYNYRATIFLDNGAIVYTDTATVYYGDAQTFIVFPNPVSSSFEEVSIISDGVDLTMEFYDTTGKIVKSKPLAGSLFRVSVSDVNPGLYLYRILRRNKPVASGRLIIK